MKKILFILLILITGLSFSQSKLVGSALMTDNQKTVLIERSNNTSDKWSGYYSDVNGDLYNDWNELNDESELFFSDISSTGIDSGRWDNLDWELNIDPTRTSGVTVNIHSASVIAHLENDANKALIVFKEMVAVFEQPNMSVALLPEGGGKATNPDFVSCVKMAMYIESYGEIQPLINTDSYYLANYAFVEAYFKSWADWAYEGSDPYSTWGVNWETGTYDSNSWPVKRLAYPDEFGNSDDGVDFDGRTNTSSSAQQYTHYLVDGTGVNSVGWKQAGHGNNRHLEISYLAYIYGVYFGDETYRDFGYNMYKAWMEICVFPDGTLAEWYRSYETDPNQGFTYHFVTLGVITRFAHTWAVGVTNGLPNMTNVGKFYDYETRADVGVETHTTDYPGTSTAGVKSLYQIIMNYSKYFRTPANGGHNPERRAVSGDIYDRGDKPFPVIPIMANSYFQTQEMQDFADMEASEGYPTIFLSSFGPAFRWSGGAWPSLILKTGGYADIDNVFSESQTIAPTTTLREATTRRYYGNRTTN